MSDPMRRWAETIKIQHIDPAVNSVRSAAASATQQAVEGLQAHIARVASLTQTGHTKASATVHVDANGVMSTGYVAAITTAATTWTVTHNLGRYCTVTVLDASGYVINDTVRDAAGVVLTTTIQQTSVNVVVVTHATAQTGTVICT